MACALALEEFLGLPIAAPAAVVSAALDALAGLGVTDLEMPITSEQIWRRIGEARGKSSSFRVTPGQ